MQSFTHPYLRLYFFLASLLLVEKMFLFCITFKRLWGMDTPINYHLNSWKPCILLSLISHHFEESKFYMNMSFLLLTDWVSLQMMIYFSNYHYHNNIVLITTSFNLWCHNYTGHTAISWISFTILCFALVRNCMTCDECSMQFYEMCMLWRLK